MTFHFLSFLILYVSPLLRPLNNVFQQKNGAFQNYSFSSPPYQDHLLPPQLLMRQFLGRKYWFSNIISQATFYTPFSTFFRAFLIYHRADVPTNSSNPSKDPQNLLTWALGNMNNLELQRERDSQRDLSSPTEKDGDPRLGQIVNLKVTFGKFSPYSINMKKRPILEKTGFTIKLDQIKILASKEDSSIDS